MRWRFAYGLLISVLATLLLSRYASKENLDVRLPDGLKTMSFTEIEQQPPAITADGWSDKIPAKPGTFWIAKSIQLDQPLEKGSVLKVVGSASYDVYWNGERIGSNGQWGFSKRQESAGLFDRDFIIPKHLNKAGSHRVMLKASNFYATHFARFLYLDIKESHHHPDLKRRVIFVHVLAGCFGLACVFFLLIYLMVDKHSSFAWFSILSFFFLSLAFTEYMKFYTSYTYPFHYVRLELIAWMTIAIAYILPFFFKAQFSIAWPSWFGRFYSLLLIGIYLLYQQRFDTMARTLIYVSSALSFIILVQACHRKRQGSLFVTIGLLCWIPFLGIFYDIYLFVGFGFLSLFAIMSLIFQLRGRRIEQEHSLRRSIRLEFDLLKKNIQPHFLMNSLAVAIEWVELDPKKGVYFLEQLAVLLRKTIDLSEKTSVPLSEEIHCCQSYLEIMKLRYQRDFQLKTVHLDPHQHIPPGVFLTLLENGITHMERKAKEVEFVIEYQYVGTWHHFRFLSPSPSQIDSPTIGTGHRYIRSRLEENYQQSWQFTSHAGVKGWIDIIAFQELQ